ncbi:hypothetical protein ACIPK8_08095, partial [Enterobacter bugandensis]
LASRHHPPIINVMTIVSCQCSSGLPAERGNTTEDKKLWASRPDVPARCVVSANACWYFKSISEEAEQASLAVLARHTVASALDEVKKADTSGCDPLPELIAQYKKA